MTSANLEEAKNLGQFKSLRILAGLFCRINNQLNKGMAVQSSRCALYSDSFIATEHLMKEILYN